ncbi:unnamed protein product [Pleuronectes platessa]|uniref:Uncharacterized protein n=1 Tax=Pleuronectes platessa TaxID=8262 RepID=A0A9N7V9A0_PLEPL|nr:unnamed protein product [Pleuronectes platessa]
MKCHESKVQARWRDGVAYEERGGGLEASLGKKVAVKLISSFRDPGARPAKTHSEQQPPLQHSSNTTHFHKSQLFNSPVEHHLSGYPRRQPRAPRLADWFAKSPSLVNKAFMEAQLVKPVEAAAAVLARCFQRKRYAGR